MSPTLTLRRKKSPEPEVDDVELEDPLPIADGRHQVTSNWAAKAATAGLLTCLVLGPVGAAAGALALAQSNVPAPTAAPTETDRSNERAVAGQFAQQVVVTWLTATQEAPEALLALVKDAQASSLSETPFAVTNPSVAGITLVDGTWSVTVAATVTDARKSTARRYFQVPVRLERGQLTAVTLPTPVSAPPTAPGSSTGYRAQVDTTTPLGQTVAQFLGAYVAGTGDVSRYLTPGVNLAPLTPAPYTSVQLSEIRAEGSEQPPTQIPDGTKVRVLVLASGQVTTKQTAPLAYALSLTARAGRWEITRIDPAPAQAPTTPGSATAPGTAPSTPAEATTTPDGSTSPTTP